MDSYKPPADFSAPGFRVGDWSVFPQLNRIVRNENTVHLEPRMMDLLLFLARHPGEVVPKNDIIDSVWDDLIIANSALSRCMALLRRALGDDARHPTYIETIPKRGYRLIAGVKGLDPSGEDVDENESRFSVLVGGRVITLQLGENIIGRAPEARVWIDSPKVSRYHAKIFTDDETAILEDVGSKNGTYLSRQKLVEPTTLADRDEIVVGSVLVKFFLPELGMLTETISSDDRPVDDEPA